MKRWLERGIARELEVGQADAVDEDLVCANGSGRFEAYGAAGGDKVVLIHAVTADTEAADERPIPEKSDGPRKENHAAFVAIRCARLIALRAGILQILKK